MKTHQWISWALISFVPACVALGQENLRDFAVGARNASLVNANIAEAADISVMYEDPATLAFLEHSGVMITHSQDNVSNGMQENLALPLVLEGAVAIGFGIEAYHVGYFAPSIPDSVRFLQYGYTIALAVELTSTLSLGGSAAVQHGISGDGSKAWGTDFSVGAAYAPTADISYGLVFSGLGRDIGYLQNDSSLTALNGVTARTLEVGATMTYPSSISLRQPILVISLANEKIFGTRGLYYKGGIEIRPLDFLELRFGYLAGPSLWSARYGVGLLGEGITLQYAAYPQHITHRLFQQLSVSVNF